MKSKAVGPPVKPSSDLTRKQIQQRVVVAAALADGMSIADVAATITKDEKKRKQWRGKIRRWMAYDSIVREEVATAIKGEAMGHLLAGIAGAGARAARGRTDSLKLLLELTDVHNPRVQKHEHSGEVKVTVSAMPRPQQIESGLVVEGTAEEI